MTLDTRTLVPRADSTTKFRSIQYLGTAMRYCLPVSLILHETFLPACGSSPRVESVWLDRLAGPFVVPSAVTMANDLEVQENPVAETGSTSSTEPTPAFEFPKVLLLARAML
eukprot:SAG11_NODE_8692_length_984_cov_10.638106_2_plen_112_part_00